MPPTQRPQLWTEVTHKTSLFFAEEVQSDSTVRSTRRSLDFESIKKIWRLNIPPKIKMFWWKLLHDGLPVAYNLNQRGCKLEPTCKVRGDYDENIDHMLIQCRVAREIWSLALQGAETELDQNSSAIINLLRSVLNATHGSSRLSVYVSFVSWLEDLEIAGQS